MGGFSFTENAQNHSKNPDDAAYMASVTNQNPILAD